MHVLELTWGQSRKEQMEQIMKSLQEDKVELDEPAQPDNEAAEQKEDTPAQPEKGTASTSLR